MASSNPTSAAKLVRNMDAPAAPIATIQRGIATLNDLIHVISKYWHRSRMSEMTNHLC